MMLENVIKTALNYIFVIKFSVSPIDLITKIILLLVSVYL